MAGETIWTGKKQDTIPIEFSDWSLDSTEAQGIISICFDKVVWWLYSGYNRPLVSSKCI